MTQIDAIDARILLELQANGRLTMKALAERVGLSSPAMIERVRRLESNGIIAGYRAIVAPDTLGRPMAVVIMATVSAQDTPRFLEALDQEPGVVECHRLTGRFDHLIKAFVADRTELASLLDLLSESGATCEASIVLDSPVEWRALAAAGDVAQPGGRLRRRRNAEDQQTDESKPVVRRPGRPRSAAS